MNRKILTLKLSNLNPNSLLSGGLLGILLIGYIALVYVLIITLGTALMGRTPSNSLLPSAQQWQLNLIAAILLAFTFVPVSRWLYLRVNDLVYAQHDNPYALTATVNHQLQTMSNPDLTLPLVLETMASMLHLPHIKLDLHYADLSKLFVYGIPPAEAQTRQFPILYLNQQLGTMMVSERSANRPLTESDRIALQECAQQTGIALYVTQLTADLQNSRERLIVAREEERRRIRNDLHDGLAPSLSSFQLQLSAIRKFLHQNPAEAEKLIRELSDDLRQATGEIRRLVYDLRPPMLDDLGLAAAIRHIKLPASSIRLEVITPEPMPALPAATEVAIYRIASEAIHNVVKHAQATCCTIVLEMEEETITLSVTDDGKSPAVSYANGIGMQSMQERAAELGGTFSIQAHDNGGTQIEVRLPMEMT